MMWQEVEQRSNQTLTEGLKESGLEELDPRQLWERPGVSQRETSQFIAVPPPLPQVPELGNESAAEYLDGRGG
ncbi:hypothetical protein FYJ24_06200 [Actinomycetaceae bacterium WB03_NA08]|uniref:Uncharacterized protein n=1 Tax=Scrofimicrobium canadense TaxID=2652290 RepID=A0A6N7W4M0_9ACTO|nr:hypothetical protein [Scrofimicrobium canadense]MSS84361.1 hypothetical protein [Scrofimicrobium canadense]